MAILFHQHLRETARPVWEAIFAHPFVRELGAGTLARARFLFWLMSKISAERLTQR